MRGDLTAAAALDARSSPASRLRGCFRTEPSLTAKPVDPCFGVICLPRNMIDALAGFLLDVSFNVAPNNPWASVDGNTEQNDRGEDDPENAPSVYYRSCIAPAALGHQEAWPLARGLPEIAGMPFGLMGESPCAPPRMAHQIVASPQERENPCQNRCAAVPARDAACRFACWRISARARVRRRCYCLRWVLATHFSLSCFITEASFGKFHPKTPDAGGLATAPFRQGRCPDGARPV